MSRRYVSGNSYASVSVSGVDGIHKALAKWLEPELTAELDAVNKKAANSMAKALRAEVKPVSRRMSRAVRVRRAKTGKPGWVVGSRRKVAFFWPFVIGGTKAHGPRKARALAFKVGGKWVRASRVKGVGANPLVERVASRYEPQVMRQIDQDMTRMTGS